MPLGLVLLEPVKSAEPPIISGTAAVKASSALSDAARVAISFGAALSFSFTRADRGGELVLRQLAGDAPLELGALVGWQRLQALAPGGVRAPSSAGRRRARARATSVGTSKARLRPAELVARALDLVGAERRAVAFLGAGLGRRAEADHRAAGDQRRPIGEPRLLDRDRDRVGVVPVDAGRGPARRLESLHLVDRIGKRQRSVDRDAVVVEQHDQLAELEVSGERDRLLAEALHQVAVGGEHIGVMVDDVAAEFGGEMPLGDRHADRIAEPLPERPGRGLDARRDEVLRMTRRDRAELAEALDLLDRHRLVAEQMQQRVDQHRAVAGREHEAVAVGPRRIGRIELEEAREQHGRDVGRAHRQAGMAGFRLLDRVHGERADGVGHAVVQRTRRSGRAVIAAGRGGRRSGCRGGGEGRLRAGHAWARGLFGERLARGRGESKNTGRGAARHAQTARGNGVKR